MTPHRVDYNRIAASYDLRYRVDALQGIADALIGLASRFSRPAILEIGCGTGRWLRDLESYSGNRCGVDPSIEMLRKHTSGTDLVNGHANALPFGKESFHLIYSVNAFHHFYNPRESIAHATATLKPTGVLAIIGIDPRAIRKRYLYDFFEGTYQLDLDRYPSFDWQIDWMAEIGLDNVEHRIVHTWTSRFIGRDVLSDPFLEKNSNSLLALLSEDEYRAGRKRMEQSISQASDEGKEAVFETVIPFGIVAGTRTT